MCPTSTQPYIFKVEYHQVTTLHTHCYSQCVSMCPTSTQPYIFKVEYHHVTTPKIHIAIHNVCPCAQLQPSLYIFKMEYHHKTTLHTHCYSQCVSMCPTSTQPYIFKVEYQQVTTLKYTLLFTMCVHVPNFNPALHFQSGVSSGNNPKIHIAIHNVCPCAQLQPSPTFSKWSIIR